MNCRRIGWTSTSDGEVGCPDLPGAVGDDEEIARLLHDGNADRPKDRLRRDELFGDRRATIVRNVCHDALGSGGASLIRRLDRSDDDLRQRSEAYARQKEGREPRGAIVGTAGAVRRIRSRIKPEVQVAFVYDDPTSNEAGHCVVRCSTDFRTEGDYLRTEVLAALSRSVPQDA